MDIADLSKRRKSENLVVIEKSDPTLKEAIVSTLAKEGFKVATYSDHLEALLRLDELKPALIILGEGLSVDSFEACSQLRQAVDAPIIILGKVPGATAWPKAVESGADLYLVRTFYYSELVARVKAILRRRDWTLAEDNLVKRREASRGGNDQ